MSEQKRATLSTISTQKGDVKKVKEKPKTIRFSLTLPESNEKSCPEYNYKDLLNSAEKKNKSKDKPIQGHVNGLNHLDPFDDDDDADVKRIARQFEEKYGNVPKKRRRGKRDDYADIGAGYDETDSFIDNTDAYDEVVPENVTTVHGGFYINSGALEFKQVELSGSEESSDSDTSEKITTRKRVIQDSDESESEEEKEEKKTEEVKPEHLEKKLKIETNGIPKPTAKKKLVLDDVKDIKRKKIEENFQKKKIEENIQKKKPITVKDLLREKREELEVESDSPQKETKPSGSSSTINDAIESVINAVRDDTTKDSSSSSDVAVVSVATSESESSRDGATDQPQTEIVRVEPEIPVVKLPDNIPTNILEIINNIKKAAENSSEGKVKFFSGPVNNMLLSLEINSRKLVKSNRLQIYEHLAPFVKCKKDTLIRRAKNLLLEHERSKLKDPLQRLKLIVDNAMPIIEKNYQKECQKVRDEMFLASANANSENGDPNCKVKRTPRKKFPWSEDARRAFQEIVLIQKKCFTLEGHRKEPFEMILEQYLKTAVLPIWPEGWMSIAALNKQVKIITENSVKQKMLKTAKSMKPVSLDMNIISPVMPPFANSPVKKSPSCPGITGITVIPITQPLASPKSSVNGPKIKNHSPLERKTSEISVTVNKTPVDNSAVLNMSAEISAVNSKDINSMPSSLLIPSNNSSVTITSLDLRTNTSTNSIKKDINNDDIEVTVTNNTDHILKTVSKPIEHISKPVEPIEHIPKLVDHVSNQTTTNVVKPTNLKQRILESSKPPTPVPISRRDSNDDCQIIDLTDSPVLPNRKPGPKSKTRNPDGSIKQKRLKEPDVMHQKLIKKDENTRKTDEITGNQALTQLITGLTKYGSNSSEVNAKQQSYSKDIPSANVNEDDMEQVMKDLKELQQMQEHARKNELDLMSPSSSPVSVIAYNSNYSPSKIHADDLSKTRRQSADGSGFQDIFQKHLFQDASIYKTTQSSSVYNSQQKNNYNSVNNFSYSSPGNISNSMNNIRYTQSSSKYPTTLNHLPSNTAGATNHTDDFALFQNFLYQYGFHNASGPKQKSPP